MDLNSISLDLIIELYELVNAQFVINDGKIIDAY